MKWIKWIWENILFLYTIFLIVFIPLFPKIPLIDVVNTWVYVRVEDFFILGSLFFWGLFVILRKTTLKTPLTIPIFLFWIIGAVSTLHSVLLIFPHLANVFPNVAFLSLLRRIEYLSLFFVAYSGMRDKKYFYGVIAAVTITLLGVIGYGFGQKYLGFPAFLTMNEEFAKGIPIQLSALSRVPSTFAGHYDLAAYLVLVIPIMVSLLFGVKQWVMKSFFAVVSVLGFVLLFMTVSRVSFFVLFVALFIVLYFQKRKIILITLPILFVLVLGVLSAAPALLDRFGNTVKEIEVMVNAQTGEVIGHTKYVDSESLGNPIIRRKMFIRSESLGFSGQEINGNSASSGAFLDPQLLPKQVLFASPPNLSTGEDLPQGTGYINLSLSPVIKRLGEFYYQPKIEGNAQSEIIRYEGDFLIKKAAAYDLSFTTRYQGEWPNAILAFQRNILLGSGYGSVSLAVDNNYLRLLGEVGLLGLISFVSLFIVLFYAIKKTFPFIDSSVIKSFLIGSVAGITGLFLNALLIDVFEASKIALSLWLLVGSIFGILHYYQKSSFDWLDLLKQVALSKYAILSYFFIAAFLLYFPILSHYFIGDDFTWLRWASDCSINHLDAHCSAVSRIRNYLISSDGFFYRPGTKIYFLFMYSFFWLNQSMYHLVSILLHAIACVLVYLLIRKVFKENVLSIIAAGLFLIIAGYSEIVFWISSTGHLFNIVAMLLSIHAFLFWKQTKREIFFIVSVVLSFVSLLFHELGIVVPFLLLGHFFIEQTNNIKQLSVGRIVLLFLPNIMYFILRLYSQSHWLNGDYSYNLLKLPFNTIGNSIGYFLMAVFGPISGPFYLLLRTTLREHIWVGLLVCTVFVIVGFLFYRYVRFPITKEEIKVMKYSALYFFVPLIPFLGLGNISSRYSYLSTVGVVILLTVIYKKLFGYLQRSGKDIAYAGMTLVILVFILFQTIQFQELFRDWKTAGQNTEIFFKKIDSLYADHWSKEKVTFHFVNVPIREGNAWVFPVGLSDALWFVFQNPQLKIYQWKSLADLPASVESSYYEKIFLFTSGGEIEEQIISHN